MLFFVTPPRKWVFTALKFVTPFWSISKRRALLPNTFRRKKTAKWVSVYLAQQQWSWKMLVFTLNVTPLFQFRSANISETHGPFHLILTPFFCLADHFIWWKNQLDEICLCRENGKIHWKCHATFLWWKMSRHLENSFSPQRSGLEFSGMSLLKEHFCRIFHMVKVANFILIEKRKGTTILANAHFCPKMSRNLPIDAFSNILEVQNRSPLY